MVQNCPLAVSERGINIFTSEFSKEPRGLRTIRINPLQPIYAIDHVQVFTRKFFLPLSALIQNKLFKECLVFATALIRHIAGVTLKSAWFMSHRIREAMRDGNLAPLGGFGEVVEADETYYGKKAVVPTMKANGQPFLRGGHGAHKMPIVSLVQRGGAVRSFHVDHANKVTVAAIVTQNVRSESRLHTDESRLYRGADGVFASHETVNHGNKEYARGDVNTNSVEGFFSIFKRGMKGIYQHCQEKHLHRYLSEYDFRYNNRTALGVDDESRAAVALRGVVGKRLTYKTVGGVNA
jgi:hypothetical protein